MKNIKQYLKKHKRVVRVYKKLNELYYNIATIISPKLNTKLRYKQVFKQKINLKSPNTFNEKLLWLKLNTYYKNPLVIQCADKYAVREYIKSCGYSDILNELYNVYNNVDEIRWENLPKQFVLKWNFGAGFNIICNDKNKLDIKETQQKLKKWGRNKHWLSYSEMQYKYAPKKIICEKYLDSEQGFLPYDYKIYCFNGTPKAILVIMDREEESKGVFMSLDWELIGTIDKYPIPKVLPPKPVSLMKMIDASIELSKPFPFVRIDFYEYKNKAIFGEMTFTPAGCIYTSQTKINGVEMSDMLSI